MINSQRCYSCNKIKSYSELGPVKKYEGAGRILICKDCKSRIRLPQKLSITPQRASEVLAKGDNRFPWSSHMTREEINEINSVWSGMPWDTCWYDALVYVANGWATEKPAKRMIKEKVLISIGTGDIHFTRGPYKAYIKAKHTLCGIELNPTHTTWVKDKHAVSCVRCLDTNCHLDFK